MSEIIKFSAIFHLSEIISEMTYEISVVTYPCKISLVPRPLSFFRERKGLVDLRMWFCVTANAQNLGVILIYRIYLHPYSTRYEVN